MNVATPYCVVRCCWAWRCGGGWRGGGGVAVNTDSHKVKVRPDAITDSCSVWTLSGDFALSFPMLAFRALFSPEQWVCFGRSCDILLDGKSVSAKSAVHSVIWRYINSLHYYYYYYYRLCDFAGTLVPVPKSTKCYWDVNLILFKLLLLYFW